MLNNFKILKVLNEAWQSNTNPIETYIGLIKREFYKRKVQIGCNPNIQDGKNLNKIQMKELI